MRIEGLTEADLDVGLTKKHKCDSVDESAGDAADGLVVLEDGVGSLVLGGVAGGLVVSKITLGVKNQDRVNVFVGGKFFCSLDVAQVGELGLKVGLAVDEEFLERLKRASEFGKLYVRALEYVMMRPRSAKEVGDYLRRKTLDRRVGVRDERTGEYGVRVREGFDAGLVGPVMERLVARGYVDDLRFARVWVENRNALKGISRKKLVVELRCKGIELQVIEEVLAGGGRSDGEEIRKVIKRKRGRYDDVKLKQYLMRQGFSYDDVVENLNKVF